MLDFKEIISEDLRRIKPAQGIVEMRTRIKQGEKKEKRMYDGKEEEEGREGISVRM
jgi:hypothetical protein